MSTLTEPLCRRCQNRPALPPRDICGPCAHEVAAEGESPRDDDELDAHLSQWGWPEPPPRERLYEYLYGEDLNEKRWHGLRLKYDWVCAVCPAPNNPGAHFLIRHPALFMPTWETHGRPWAQVRLRVYRLGSPAFLEVIHEPSSRRERLAFRDFDADADPGRLMRDLLDLLRSLRDADTSPGPGRPYISPNAIQAFWENCPRAYAELAREMGRAPHQVEVAYHLNMDVRTLRRWLRRAHLHWSELAKKSSAERT